MRTIVKAGAATAIIAAVGFAGTAHAQTTEGPLGDGMVMYMQMGGKAGDGATLARTTGARDAAKAFGIKLIEQYSLWQPETMLNHFREAQAASPTCIGIMGHPGSDAFADLVAEARADGVIVTSGNAPLTELYRQYQAGGFGYAGVDLYPGGYITGEAMVRLLMVGGSPSPQPAASASARAPRIVSLFMVLPASQPACRGRSFPCPVSRPLGPSPAGRFTWM